MPVTPMMQQYLDVKEQNPDAILFFRLGDFYEMFFDDAKLASRELELTLTGKDCGLSERAPMCGVPYHAVDVYVQKLIEILHRLAEGGNTVVVIEHNLDVIKCADHIIDLGPDGGDGGGTIVATGTPEEVAMCPESYTGQYLKRILEKAGRL